MPFVQILVAQFPFPLHPHPGGTLVPFAGGQINATQQDDEVGTKEPEVQVVPPPPQTFVQQSLLLLQGQPPSLDRLLLFPLHPQIVEAALIAAGAIIDEIIGNVIIEAKPIRLTISRRFIPSKGVVN